MDIEAKVKMFLFARWIATCYADTHLDEKKRSEHDKGFNQSNSMSVLNREDGYWYKKQLEHFENVVWPNYIENGSVQDTQEFLNDNNENL